MPNPFAILDDDRRSRDGVRLPTFEPGTESLRRGDGESVLYIVGDCALQIGQQAPSGGPWHTVWTSPAPGTLTVTNLRTVYGCRQFETGPTWGGLGAAGLLAGLALTAYSRHRARVRTCGQCFAAQAWHRTVVAVDFGSAHHSDPQEIGLIRIDFAADDGRWRFTLHGHGRGGTTPPVARAIAEAAPREPA